MSFDITAGMIAAFGANVKAAYEHKSLLAGMVGKYEGVQVIAPLTAQQRSRRDIESVRHQLSHAQRRHAKRLAKRLARMEDKYAQRSLLGWDWLKEHPEHPLHIPDLFVSGMTASEVVAHQNYAIKTFAQYGQVLLGNSPPIVHIDTTA